MVIYINNKVVRKKKKQCKEKYFLKDYTQLIGIY